MLQPVPRDEHHWARQPTILRNLPASCAIVHLAPGDNWSPERPAPATGLTSSRRKSTGISNPWEFCSKVVEIKPGQVRHGLVSRFHSCTSSMQIAVFYSISSVSPVLRCWCDVAAIGHPMLAKLPAVLESKREQLGALRLHQHCNKSQTILPLMCYNYLRKLGWKLIYLCPCAQYHHNSL